MSQGLFKCEHIFEVHIYQLEFNFIWKKHVYIYTLALHKGSSVLQQIMFYALNIVKKIWVQFHA